VGTRHNQSEKDTIMKTEYTINLAKAGTGISVDFSAMPENAQAFVIEYGLRQILNDCASSVKKGEKDAPAIALGLAEKRLAKLMAGDFTRTAGGAKLSGFEAELEKATIAVAKRVAMAKFAGFSKLPKDEKTEVLAKLAAHPKVIEQAKPIAEAAWAAKQEATSLDFDIEI